MLTNPNAAVEWMRSHGKVQDGLYSRFIERLPEIGAYGDIEALHAYWAALKEAERVADEVAKQASSPSVLDEPAPAPPTKPKRARRTNANA